MGWRVLFVHESSDLSTAVRRFFVGYPAPAVVESVATPEDALDRLAETEYDVVVAGNRFPGMDCIDLLRAIRGGPGGRTPFVCFPSNGSESLAAEALNAGADRYLAASSDPRDDFGTLAEFVDDLCDQSSVEESETEAALVQARNELQRIYDTAPVMITRKDTENTILRVNEAVTDYVGLPREEIEGRSAADLFEQGEAFHEMDLAVVAADEPMRGMVQQLTTPSGVERWMKTDAMPYRDATGETVGVLIVSEDITEFKRIEEALQERTELLQFALQAANGGVLDWDVRTDELEFGDDGPALVGDADAAESMTAWLDRVHPDERDELRRALDGLFRGEEAFEVEYRVEVDAGDYRWVIGKGSVVRRDEDGTPVRVSGIYLDVDERKRAEERETFLHSLLRHDLANDLQAASGYLAVVRDADLPPAVERNVETIEASVDDATGLIEKVRTLREIDGDDPEPVLVSKAIAEAVEKYDERAERADIDVEFDRVDQRVLGGPLLVDLFANLVGNALQHADASRIRIDVSPQGDEVVCTVEDDGRGIPSGELASIFEKGRRYGDTGGTGLGTYLVREIAASYGGRVSAGTSDLGGASFEVRLPAV